MHVCSDLLSALCFHKHHLEMHFKWTQPKPVGFLMTVMPWKRVELTVTKSEEYPLFLRIFPSFLHNRDRQ